MTSESTNHRWATRKEAMAYGRIGSTKLNDLMRAGKLRAKKLGRKVLIDLQSMDDLYASLPEVGASI
jgi:hypothetical protein